MLKYQILANDTTTEYVTIPYREILISEDGSTLTVTLVNPEDVSNGDTIYIQNTVYQDDGENKVSESVTYRISHTVMRENNVQELVIELPARLQLSPSANTYYDYVEPESGDNLRFYVLEFDSPHGFTSDDDPADIILYMTSPYVTDENGVPVEQVLKGEYYSTNALLLNSTASENDIIFNGGYSSIFETAFARFSFYRNDYRFTRIQDFSILKRNAVYTLDIPVNSLFCLDGYKEDLVTNNFIEKEVAKTVPDIIDMEKDVYYPVYTNRQGKHELVDKIVVNLHFRERSGDNWVVDREKFWNGVQYPDNWDATNPLTKPTVGFEFDELQYDNISRQADLLSYLEFTDSDVRYQKNRLKKSFLRFLVYDSPNEANQNLLSTATVFVDTGRLYGKVCRYVDSGPFYYVKGGELAEGYGTKVNREPSYELLQEEDNGNQRADNDYDDLRDDMRLCAQFIIDDKYNTEASSEGFYLYLFKMEDTMYAPRDLYMKVEFNHAGVGRTLPFMYPTEEDSGYPLSFEGIIDDWYTYTDDNVMGRSYVVGYTMKRYNDYSYIRLRCVYSEELQQHVYYLASECADNVDIDNRKMVLNLYEAKVG